MCRIGGRLGDPHASEGGAAVEIPPFSVFGSNPHQRGQCLAGSLTGAVASQNVTEAPKGPLRADGNRSKNALA